MLLAIDIGNTQTVLGLYDSATDSSQSAPLLDCWRIATVLTDTSDEIMVRLMGLLQLNSLTLSDITDVAIASVVPSLTKQWRVAGKRMTGSDPLVVDSTTDTGLAIKYRHPSEIGADRLAVAVAAIARYGAPVVVVDDSGAFIGGIISPGLMTSAEALFSAAARLSKIEIEIPETVIGTTTHGAVQSGLTYGEIDRIDGLIRRIFAELGYSAPVIATGGLSSKVVKLSSTITAVNDDLALEGLRLLHRRLRNGY